MYGVCSNKVHVFKSHGVPSVYHQYPTSLCEADRLFHALDSNKSGRISFDDFVVGLAVCCRGSLEEKMRFLFGVYDMNGVNY